MSGVVREEVGGVWLVGWANGARSGRSVGRMDGYCPRRNPRRTRSMGVVFLLDGARVCVTLAHPAFSLSLRCRGSDRDGGERRESREKEANKARERSSSSSRVLAAV